MVEEEWVYILSGRGLADIDGQQYEVGPGDFMGFPSPGIAHLLRNPFEEELVYLMGGEAVPLDGKLRLRQHAGHRRGHHIGEPHRRAEHAGAIEHAGGDEFPQPRRQLIVHHQADVAEEHRERQIGASGMVDAAEPAMGDDIERLLAAIIGMRAPADVAEQARCVTQPAFLARLIET